MNRLRPFAAAGRGTRPFAAVAALDLVAVAADLTALRWLTKPLLAPLLLAHLVARRRRVDAVAVGLLFATAGDVALLLPGDTAFLVGMAFFLGTQISFLTAFLRHRRPPAAAVTGYLALWALANALLWQALGPLRLPFLGYSLALSLMAAAAAGVSRRVAIGGALFLVSDALIGLGAAGVGLPGRDLAVMATYIAALLLITTGWVTASAGPVAPAARARPDAGPPARPAVTDVPSG